MKTEKKANLKIEKIDQQPEELADLPATDEQAQEAKGGSGGQVPYLQYKLVD